MLSALRCPRIDDQHKRNYTSSVSAIIQGESLHLTKKAYDQLITIRTHRDMRQAETGMDCDLLEDSRFPAELRLTRVMHCGGGKE